MDTSSKIGKQAGAKSAKREHPQTEGRRDRNKREKVARTPAAARTLFHAKAYTKTTTPEVAEAADHRPDRQGHAGRRPPHPGFQG